LRLLDHYASQSTMVLAGVNMKSEGRVMPQ